MTSKQTKQPVNLAMTIDLGGSMTKIVVQKLGSDSPLVLLMESQLADFGEASLNGLPKEGKNSDRAWVGFTKPSSNGAEEEKVYYSVGALARNRFGGLSQLHELKYELALPKILAAIWLVSIEMSLSPKFNLYLTVLLPSGEMSDEDILKSRLLSCIKDFDTPDGKMKIKLVLFRTSSEGSGLYLYRKKILGEKLNSISQIIVMLGFRNASAFVARCGVIEPGSTSDFGMHWMLNFLENSVSGLDKNDPRTIQTIVEGASNPKLLKKLSRKSSPADIETDFQSISAAIKLAKDEYVRAIVRWLKSLVRASSIVFCGGTAEYLRPELERHYSNDSTEIVWHGGVLIPSEFESLLGSNRLADVWALHGIFFDMVTDHNAAKMKNSSTKKKTSSDRKKPPSKKADQNPLPYKSVVPEIKVSNSKPTRGIVYERTERPTGTLPPIVS